MKFELFHQEAPRACANFLNLIRRGYYLGKQWDDFSPVVRQLGTAVDLKDLPYQLPREFSPKRLFNEGGLLCLANTTEDSRARGHPCRIFITVAAGAMESQLRRVRKTHRRHRSRAGDALWRTSHIDRSRR